jgi:hypothetical protein
MGGLHIPKSKPGPAISKDEFALDTTDSLERIVLAKGNKLICI